jgi:hypothetical protein
MDPARPAQRLRPKVPPPRDVIWRGVAPDAGGRSDDLESRGERPALEAASGVRLRVVAARDFSVQVEPLMELGSGWPHVNVE